MTGIKAVCFDGFGAVVQIDQSQKPFERLLEHDDSGYCLTAALTRKMTLTEIAQSCRIAIDDAALKELEFKLFEECASSRTRVEMDFVWAALRRLRMKIAVCSNIAAPYEESLLACLPGIPEALIFSFEVGFLSTQFEFFDSVATRLELRACEILYIGSLSDGSIAAAQMSGMLAMPVCEFMEIVTRTDLDELPDELSSLFARLTRTTYLYPQSDAYYRCPLGPTVPPDFDTETARRSQPEPFDHLPI